MEVKWNSGISGGINKALTLPLQVMHLRIWTKDGRLLYTGKQEGNSVLWGVDWISDSKKIVTVILIVVIFSSGMIKQNF